MGVDGDRGRADLLLAEFQAKMLLYGGPPEYDPAEEHTRWFLRVAIVWTVVVAVVGGGVLWITDWAFAAIAVGTATVIALAAVSRRLGG